MPPQDGNVLFCGVMLPFLPHAFAPLSLTGGTRFPFPTEAQQGLPVNDEQDEEGFIISVLQDVLPHGVDIRTCEDFKHLGVVCCEMCHDFDNGGKAVGLRPSATSTRTHSE